MPGILIMDHESGAATGSRDAPNRKRNFEGQLVNGDPRDAPPTPAVNGTSSKASATATALAAVAPPASTPDRFSELPPEIVHISQELYHPLSTLLLRISQETYNQLSETLQTMADMPLVQHANGIMANGAGALRGGQENEETNRRKKLLLMKFAQDNRAKFIKLLVLTEWGKKAARDVSKLIDLFSWAREQKEHMDFVDVQIERIKLYTSAAGERNPDIATALEVLSTGKAPWMPTLGYIPPHPISPEQGLELFRYMNTSLSVRLHVHENLPRRLQNWRIESGRATFVVVNDLEFDVVSAVEDTSDQWWFVDVRLLFSPAPIITSGSHFFNRLQPQADAILREKGLVGLFDFFSNFVLTHKISVLRSQAMRLATSEWAGSLKVENVHRELVVSYWTNRPGKKNWIEIGVSNNRTTARKTSWRGPPSPSLTVRWFRRGVEVKDANFDFDWQNLSFERMIKHVTARHIDDVLRTTREQVNPKIATQALSSDSEPADCKLHVTLGTDSNSVTLSQEPVTGNYILQPATALSAKAETAFNQGRDPKLMASILMQLLAQTLQDLVQKSTQQLGWHTVSRQSLHLDAVKLAVKLDVIQYAMYSPRGWSPEWAMAAVIDASGCSWWIFKLGSNGSAVEHAEHIKMDRPDGSSLTINRQTLASLERVAVQLLSIRVTALQLENEKKPFSLRYEFGQAKTKTEVQSVPRGWALYLHTTDLLTTQVGEQPWLEPNLAIVCQGLRREGRNVWHIVVGKMVKSVAADMQKLMAASPQKGFKFSEDGSFKILLSTSFGHDILGELRARLRDVNRLRSFATTLQKRQMRLGSSSLQRVQFQYGPSTHVAAVKFSAEKNIVIEMAQSNPHSRVHNLLTEITRKHDPSLPTVFSADTNGLDRLCTALVLTRPLVTAVNALENNTANVDLSNPSIHFHTLFKCRLRYKNPVCTFDVRAQPKDDKVYWFIEDNMRKHAPDLRPSPERSPTHRRLESLQEKLRQLFSSKGTRWFGTRNGIITEIDGVGEALNKLNECVLSCAMEGGYVALPPIEVPATTRPQAQQQQQQPQANAQQLNAQQQNTQQRMQAARQQQHQHAQQQAQQQQGQRRQQQQQNRPQMQNGRPQQMQQGMQNRGRPRQGQDIIEID
ncbi:mediator complex subunit MED14-domain-containing protein [Ampelomyces quisqualis]|uniref:Mediator of RNA polymerase II transcription subunit 14 n=1 Tax=Ampelomyces quisqualis TaxID=50730 RepID=A0A6A5QXM2_AMPQU|nr:mediator complex subunit MED14-domain-containing protein [Ampelomyces quisqualis]